MARGSTCDPAVVDNTDDDSCLRNVTRSRRAKDSSAQAAALTGPGPQSDGVRDLGRRYAPLGRAGGLAIGCALLAAGARGKKNRRLAGDGSSVGVGDNEELGLLSRLRFIAVGRNEARGGAPFDVAPPAPARLGVRLRARRAGTSATGSSGPADDDAASPCGGSGPPVVSRCCLTLSWRPHDLSSTGCRYPCNGQRGSLWCTMRCGRSQGIS